MAGTAAGEAGELVVPAGRAARGAWNWRTAVVGNPVLQTQGRGPRSRRSVDARRGWNQRNSQPTAVACGTDTPKRHGSGWKHGRSPLEVSGIFRKRIDEHRPRSCRLRQRIRKTDAAIASAD